MTLVHGSGSKLPHDRFRVERLEQAGAETLRLDLPSVAEGQAGLSSAGIEPFCKRLEVHLGWLQPRADLSPLLPAALFGASSAAAVALKVAAACPEVIGVLLSCGGHPDLAVDVPEDGQAPILLIVGSREREGVKLLRLAADRRRCDHPRVVLPGAGHRSEGAICLAPVAELSGDSFLPQLSVDGWRDGRSAPALLRGRPVTTVSKLPAAIATLCRTATAGFRSCGRQACRLIEAPGPRQTARPSGAGTAAQAWWVQRLFPPMPMARSMAMPQPTP